jgi:excisionase family DNA binding protein
MTMSSAHEQTVLPPRDTQVLEAIQALLAEAGEVSLLGDGGDPIHLPAPLRAVLTDVAAAMHRGQAITLAPVGQRLTTQESADLLGVSRPTLIKLLDAGKIPYETPGRHRRIRLADLLAYQALRREEQRSVLRELTEDAQDSGLYDTTPDHYEAALREARAKLA